MNTPKTIRCWIAPDYQPIRMEKAEINREFVEGRTIIGLARKYGLTKHVIEDVIRDAINLGKRRNEPSDSRRGSLPTSKI